MEANPREGICVRRLIHHSNPIKVTPLSTMETGPKNHLVWTLQII